VAKRKQVEKIVRDATAYAIAGLVPPGNVIPEQEVFVGPLAITPYETRGTKKFAETVLPYARKHNTILLGTHGIVRWADTVTHAEWLVEIVDTYCRTIMLALSLGPIKTIAPGKTPRLAGDQETPWFARLPLRCAGGTANWSSLCAT